MNSHIVTAQLESGAVPIVITTRADVLEHLRDASPFAVRCLIQKFEFEVKLGLNSYEALGTTKLAVERAQRMHAQRFENASRASRPYR